MDLTFLWNIANELPLITRLFIACIVVLWAYFFFFRFTPVVVANAPAVLTSLGIFATFVGVASGLSAFDIDDVQGSIPALLDGLKSSFWSSIVGIGGAVLIKLKHLIKTGRAERREAANESATIDDLAELLRELNRGKGTNERLDSLRRSFDEFLPNMAERNSQALINALHDVVRDFNVKVNEQFGENFKQLNDGAGKILGWQDRYRHQIGELIDRQADAAKRMTAVVEKAEGFGGLAERLGALLSDLDRQRQQVDEAASSLADVADYCRTWNLIAPTTPSQSFDGKPSERHKERVRPAVASVREA